MNIFTNATQVLPYLQSLYGRKNLADLNRFGEVLAQFRRIFGYTKAHLCSSSGRVELVGNHLDHNGGCVLACTVNLDIIVAFVPTNNNVIRIAGKGRNTLHVSVNDFEPCFGSAGLVKGVVQYLAENGYSVGGFDAYTDSVVPTGAGVSSSAAFELAVGTIISHLYNDGKVPCDVLARAGQFAENNFFGKPCGLLDQSVIAVGGVVELDFADGLHYRKLDTELDGLSLVLVNTGASHSHLSDLYAKIPADMRAVANFFGAERLIAVHGNAFFDRYDEVVTTVDEGPALRAKHFFEELARVDQMSNLLTHQTVGNYLSEQSDKFVTTILSLINESGDSSLYQLKNCAVNEQDTAIADIISYARSICPCAARVHGGGFAGTVLCVVPNGYVAEFLSAVTAKYGQDKVYSLRLRSAGTTVL